MLRVIALVGGIALSLVFLVVVLVLALLAPFLSQQTGNTGGGWSAPGKLSSVVAAAETLQNHLYGPLANTYDVSDPVIERVVQYWLTSCGNGTTLCPEARSGTLQCVLFVTGAFALGGDPLPVVGNAQDFWTLYQQRAGWQGIGASAAPPSARGLPAPGDLMVWQGGRHLEAGGMKEYGHIAVVVRVIPPTRGQDGAITVAQANAPGNQFPQQNGLAGNVSTMPLHPDLGVDGWSAFTTAQGVAYGSYTVLGYLRQLGTPPMQLPAGLARNTPYVAVAWQAAQQAGINGVFFLRQINAESGFDPQARSNAGAIGIAQFEPATARSLGVDPLDPVAALQAAARVMAQYHRDYGGDDAKALAAYNAGPGAVQQALARCGMQWLRCLPTETQQYVQRIAGP